MAVVPGQTTSLIGSTGPAQAVAPNLDWRLGLALATLLALAVAVSAIGNLGIGRRSVSAAIRATVQLSAVALIIGLILQRVSTSLLFACVMLSVATATAAGRIGARSTWPWVGITLAIGATPVLLIIFGSGAAPLAPATIVSICGIIIGNTMTAFVLATRRAFANLREKIGEVEAALALGIDRPTSIRLLIERDAPEALTPILDQTRTVGLVSLPGAFVGVLLGGGSAAQAATAQLLVLIGLLAAQSTTVTVTTRLIASGRILPPDVEERLPPA